MCRLQIEKQLVDCITVSKLWLAAAVQPQPIFLPLFVTFQAVFLIMPMLIPNPPLQQLAQKGYTKAYGFGFFDYMHPTLSPQLKKECINHIPIFGEPNFFN